MLDVAWEKRNEEERRLKTWCTSSEVLPRAEAKSPLHWKCSLLLPVSLVCSIVVISLVRVRALERNSLGLLCHPWPSIMYTKKKKGERYYFINTLVESKFSNNPGPRPLVDLQNSSCLFPMPTSIPRIE